MNFLQQFRRVTSGGRLIQAVDGLRCVAILSVILYHLEDYLTHKGVAWNPHASFDGTVHQWLHTGFVGVPLFFTLSGFILALPFFEAECGAASGRPIDFKRYYLRRLTRLEPPYLINLAIAASLLFAVKSVAWSELLPHLTASALYVHNQVYGDVSTINPVAWSLEIEVQFYLIAPLLARWLMARRPVVRRTMLLAAIAGLIAIKTVWHPLPPRFALSLAGTFEHFLAGLLLADMYVVNWKSNPTRSAGWDLVSLAVWPAVFTIPRIPLLASCLPILTLLAFVAAFRGPLTHRLLTWTPAVIVGGMCYTLYLYHFFIISFVGRFTLPLTGGWGYLPTVLIQSLIIAPVVIVSGAVLYRLFERPFMIWRPGQRAVKSSIDAASAVVAPRTNLEAALGAGSRTATGLEAETV